MRRLLIASALSGAGLLASGCDPYNHSGPGAYPGAALPVGSGPAQGLPVRALGCPIPGVQPGCLSLRATDGAVFDISAAQARPQPAGPFALEVSGRAGAAVGGCRAGTVLEEVQVRATNLRCVGGAVQQY